MKCSVLECVRPALVRGWCNAHYRRWKTYGDPLGSKPRHRRPAREYGQPGPEQVAMHSCDNPPCVNPAHLSWGTQSQNVRDGWARTRRTAK